MQKPAQRIPTDKCAHRARLSTKEQVLYDKMTEAIAGRRRSVRVMGQFTEEIGAVYSAILYDQPFFFDLNRTVVRKTISAASTTIDWDFSLSDAEYEEQRERIYRELNRLRRLIPKEHNLLQREQDIHNLMQKINLQSDRRDDCPWWTHSIVGPLLHRKTVCDGAAQLFYLLCLMMGIPCQVIVSIGGGSAQDSGPHAWNMVRLGARYAHVDAFWDICKSSLQMGICYDYFNLNDSRIRSDHSWEAVEYPVCMTEKYSWFVLKKVEAETLEQYAAILRRYRDKGLMRPCVRFRKLPPEAEIQRIVEDVYFTGRGGSFRIRCNSDQKIVHVAVEYQ